MKQRTPHSTELPRRRPRQSCVATLLVFVLLGALVAPPVASADPASPDNTGTSGAPGVNAPANETTLPLSDQILLFESRINALEKNLEIASEDINTAKTELATVQEKIAQRERELEQLRAAYEEGQAALGRQARLAYREGTLEYLEILLSSKDIPTLLDKYDYIYRISRQQQDTQEQIAQQKEELERELVGLKKDEMKAQSLEFELSGKEIEMGHRKSEYQELLDATNSRVVTQYEDTQVSRRVRDDRAFLKFLEGDYKVEKNSVVETALAYRGIPYVWGGASKSGFDCSGLVLYVFAQHGVRLPHSSRMQATMGTPVTVKQLQPGDAVFFGSPVHHVGIYVGGGYYVHAPQTGDVVKVSKLSGMSSYVGARRYAWSPRVGDPK
jgi:peptidoglycan hydrolase CwlO-like protein